MSGTLVCTLGSPSRESSLLSFERLDPVPNIVGTLVTGPTHEPMMFTTRLPMMYGR